MADSAPEDYNSQIIKEFRANQGHVGGMWADTPIILIHHTGRRSGIERVTPVACSPLGAGRYAVVASNGGSPTHPDWVHNLRARPRTTVEFGGETIAVVAEELEGDARAELWPKMVEWAPTIAEFEAKVTRQIPLVVFTRQD
jgi:deazaflavin-dependent oxidoreductase (nitroreductase family)